MFQTLNSRTHEPVNTTTNHPSFYNEIQERIAVTINKLSLIKNEKVTRNPNLSI